MSARRCDWCDVELLDGLVESGEGTFCSFDCRDDAECEAAEEEHDGQPSELTEWLDFDPDC